MMAAGWSGVNSRRILSPLAHPILIEAVPGRGFRSMSKTDLSDDAVRHITDLEVSGRPRQNARCKETLTRSPEA
jgi:hypothetical protein